MIIVSSLVVNIVTLLNQDNVSVISLVDNVPMDVDQYRVPYTKTGTLETDATFTSVSQEFFIVFRLLIVSCSHQ